MSKNAELWLCYRPFGDDCAAVRMVDEARAAVVRDTAALALVGGFAAVRVWSTASLNGLDDLLVERSERDQSVGDIVSKAAQAADGPVCYVGSGMPAMSSEDWSAALAMLERGEAVTNRMFSCDWIGVPSGRMLTAVAGERMDNRFALLVRDERGVAVRQVERSARSLLDLDTPTDLAVLAACAEVGSLEPGPHLSAVIESWSDLLGPTQARAVDVFRVMTEREAELMIAGRINGADWAVVDRNTSCRVRVLSEARGLRTRRGRTRSVLGSWYESVGCEAFVSQLSEMCDSMIWDTRPLCAHLGWRLSRSDRFWADLGCEEQIGEGPLRALVAALASRRVLCGGHSLVAGGMLAGIDQAWSRRELSG